MDLPWALWAFIHTDKIRGKAAVGLCRNYFFLWRFFLKRFLRLWVAILWRFLFLPQGIRGWFKD